MHSSCLPAVHKQTLAAKQRREARQAQLMQLRQMVAESECNAGINGGLKLDLKTSPPFHVVQQVLNEREKDRIVRRRSELEEELDVVKRAIGQSRRVLQQGGIVESPLRAHAQIVVKTPEANYIPDSHSQIVVKTPEANYIPDSHAELYDLFYKTECALHAQRRCNEESAQELIEIREKEAFYASQTNMRKAAIAKLMKDLEHLELEKTLQEKHAALQQAHVQTLEKQLEASQASEDGCDEQHHEARIVELEEELQSAMDWQGNSARQAHDQRQRVFDLEQKPRMGHDRQIAELQEHVQMMEDAMSFPEWQHHKTANNWYPGQAAAFQKESVEARRPKIQAGDPMAGHKYRGDLVRLRSKERIVRAQTRTHGDNHPEVTHALLSLASHHQERGDVQAQQEALNRAFSIQSEHTRQEQQRAQAFEARVRELQIADLAAQLATPGSLAESRQFASSGRPHHRGDAVNKVSPAKASAETSQRLRPQDLELMALETMPLHSVQPQAGVTRPRTPQQRSRPQSPQRESKKSGKSTRGGDRSPFLLNAAATPTSSCSYGTADGSPFFSRKSR